MTTGRGQGGNTAAESLTHGRSETGLVKWWRVNMFLKAWSVTSNYDPEPREWDFWCFRVPETDGQSMKEP